MGENAALVALVAKCVLIRHLAVVARCILVRHLADLGSVPSTGAAGGHAGSGASTTQAAGGDWTHGDALDADPGARHRGG